MKETYTSIETSKLMNEARSVETGIWHWVDICGKPTYTGVDRQRNVRSMNDWETIPAHNLATAMQWLEEYGKKVGWNTKIADDCCQVCGEPLEISESMFRMHGSLGPCPKPPITSKDTNVVQQALLDAYLAGNYNMASKEVSEFIRSVIK